MEITARSLGIDRLSVDDRLRLVEEIWDTIEADAGLMETPQSHIEEIDRRLAAHEDDPRAGSSWDEVVARIKGRPRPER